MKNYELKESLIVQMENDELRQKVKQFKKQNADFVNKLRSIREQLVELQNMISNDKDSQDQNSPKEKN